MRSYKIPDQSDQRLKYLRIWQAACATLATTGLFKPINVNVGETEEQFGSTANFLHSPIDYLWREACAVLLDKGQELDDHLDCIISVANMVTARYWRTGFCGKVFTVMSDVAHSAKESNQLFLENHSQLETAGRFCRLSCALELEGDSIQEHLEHAKVKTSVEQYFRSASVQDWLTPYVRKAAKHRGVSRAV